MCPQLFDRVNEFRMHLETHGGKKVKSSIPRFQDKRCTDPANSGDDMLEQEIEEEGQAILKWTRSSASLSQRSAQEKKGGSSNGQ